MTGRATKFRDDLDYYIEYVERTQGRKSSYEDVDFEGFMGSLDIEHHLGLRGPDTWSKDGNEGQIVVKTLIGQILTERLPAPTSIPEIYFDFAHALRPSGVVITFNYDILLELACEMARKTYRLVAHRYSSISNDGEALVTIYAMKR